MIQSLNFSFKYISLYINYVQTYISNLTAIHVLKCNVLWDFIKIMWSNCAACSRNKWLKTWLLTIFTTYYNFWAMKSELVEINKACWLVLHILVSSSCIGVTTSVSLSKCLLDIYFFYICCWLLFMLSLTSLPILWISWKNSMVASSPICCRGKNILWRYMYKSWEIHGLNEKKIQTI